MAKPVELTNRCRHTWDMAIEVPGAGQLTIHFRVGSKRLLPQVRRYRTAQFFARDFHPFVPG